MALRDIAVTVSGFATPGTLLLAIATFRRNRREDQLANARVVIATLDRGESSPDQVAIKIANHGDGPISQVWVAVPGDTLSEHHISIIPPGDTASVVIFPEQVEGDRPWALKYVSCGGPMTPTEPRIQLRFVDARNQAWERDGYDKPTRSKAQPDRPLVAQRHARRLRKARPRL